MHDMKRRQDGKVDVFMIGASKCGTTSVAAYLNALPEVSTGHKKEPRYFSNSNFENLTEERYHSNYDPDAPIWLDASTSYSDVWQDRSTRSAERIRDYCADARILMIVRHPFERIISEWRQMVYLLDAGNDTIATNYGVHELGRFSEDIRRYPGFVENSRYDRALAPRS